MIRSLLLPVLSLLLVSCQTTDHGIAEQTGYPDLNPLVDRVVQARNAQQAAVAQFQSTRTQLSGLVNVAGGDLQASHAAMVDEYDASVEAAVAVNTANAAVAETADGIFQQWQTETEVFTDARLKAANQTKLAQSWQSYQDMIGVLRQPEATMKPLLTDLNDKLAYLGSNPSASALAAHKVELGAIDDEIAVLMRQMNSAIASADAFIARVQLEL